MRWLKTLYLLVGVVLLALVLRQTDFAEVMQRIGHLGGGLSLVLAISVPYFLINNLSWQIVLTEAPLNFVWFRRLWRVRLVGEAFNAVMPGGGMGGEPAKAVLLKKHHGIGLRTGTAAVIIAKTVNMVALAIFMAVAFLLTLDSEALGPRHKAIIAAGLLAFCLATLIVFSLQRLRLSSRVGGWLGRWRAGKMLAGRLSAIEEMDRQFVKFYTEHTGRMGSTILLGLIPWTLGAVEIYVVFDLLGQPISLAEAVILQAVSEMARAAVFFIPSGLGAQEGVFMLLGAAFTGSPSLGVAVALVRRMRELFWIGLGFGQGGLFSLKNAPAGPQGL